MELHDILKLRNAELIKAPADKQEQLRADIGRLREAIRVDKEMRKSIVPSTDCGAAAKAERETRALASEDQAQWKFEAEARLKEVKND